MPPQPKRQKRKRDGTRARFSAIPGETPRGVLRRPLLLPAILNDFGSSEEALHRDFETVGLGEVSQPAPGKRARRLQTTEVETLAVKWDPDWLVQHGQTPGRMRRELRQILRSKRPVLLGARLERGPDAPFLVRMPVTLRSVDWTLRHGENNTLYFTLQIKEWRPLDTRRRSSKVGRRKGKRLPTTHELRERDTLRSLSRAYYGTYEHWRVIARVNGISKAGGNTRLVTLKRFEVGAKVRIPLIATTGD